jgi:tetratricopeptide (TPR) repeat protein
MKTRIVGLMAVLLVSSLWGADYPQKREIGIYFDAIKESRAQAASGDEFDSQDTMAAALDVIVPRNGMLVNYFLKRRQDIVFDSMNLRGRFERSGRLALAMREQQRSERMVNAWARSEGAAAGFDCLKDAPAAGWADELSGIIWRMRTARASLLEVQSKTLDAVELLRRTEAEVRKGARVKGSFTRHELSRTRIDLAMQLSFLGWWDESVEILDSEILDGKKDSSKEGRKNLARAEFNKLFPVSKMKGMSPEVVSDARAIIDRARGALTASAVKSYEHQIAKLELRAGSEHYSIKRLQELAKDESLSAVERMQAMRTLLIESETFADENATDETYEEYLQDYRQRGALRSLPTMYREFGFFLERSGRLRDGLKMVRKAAELTEEAGWDLHLLSLWQWLASMHDVLGEHAEAITYWERIDALLASLNASGKKIPDSRLLQVETERIDWLNRNQRLDEARAALTRVKATTQRDKVGAAHLAVLDNLTVSEKETAAPVVEAKTSELVVAPVTLQPESVQTFVKREGEEAQTRFTLLNPASLAASGQLRASGPGMQLTRDPDGTVQWEIGYGVNNAALDLEIAGGERIVIDATSMVAGQLWGLEWMEKGESISKAEWRVALDDPSGEVLRRDVRATTVSKATRSSYYATPLYQELRWRPTAARSVQNFRVRSSGNAWVSYRKVTGEMIAIDANGDGDFTDAGDLISFGYDLDDNLYPEALAEENEGKFGVEIFVYPTDGRGEITTLTFEILEEGEKWRASSEHQLGVGG